MAPIAQSAALPILDDVLSEQRDHAFFESAPAGDREALLAWALDQLAAAEQRTADLTERLAYLEGLSVTDELTRLLNRRGFLGELTRALSWARRSGSGGVVLVCDLDGFKAVNDRHGHAAGNIVLREIGVALARQVRRCDAVGRLGGDEFAFLLVGASRDGAKGKAASLSRAIERLGVVIDGTQVVLSASFGIASYDGSENEEAVLHSADIAMYEAKRRRHAKLWAVS